MKPPIGTFTLPQDDSGFGIAKYQIYCIANPHETMSSSMDSVSLESNGLYTQKEALNQQYCLLTLASTAMEAVAALQLLVS
jgi:hypothetical protein